MQQKNLAELYDLPPVPWSRAIEALEGGPVAPGTWFLATVRPDGRPHVAGVGAVWQDGKVYVVSGEGTRKSRNLAANPSCSIAVSLDGMDLVIEGEAERVTDRATLEKLAARYATEGWPATVEGQAFTHEYSAPSAGPAPWNLYVIDPVTVYAVMSDTPGGATRWRFDGEA
jgi:hypothetical protein